MDYQEFIRLSTKGDTEALEALFNLAEKLTREKKYEEASDVFRESAISYRILASKNSGIADSASSKVNSLSEEIKLYKHWIKTNSSGLRPLPRVVEGLSKEHIFKIVGIEIWPNGNPGGEFCTLLELLQSALNHADFSDYPSDSPERNFREYAGFVPNPVYRILDITNDYFGLGSSAWASNLDHIEVRIWMDLLAEEVERRFHVSKTANIPLSDPSTP